MEDYKNRLIELADGCTAALEVAEKKDQMAITNDEKVAMSKIRHLLGFIEALKTAPKSTI